MKKIAVCLLACWAVWQVSAAEEGWLTDLTKAKAQAKAEKKMVLMDFNGSDWCPPCKALHKTVLTNPEFTAYAKKNLVLVDVDFPRQKQQSEELKKANQKLSEEYGVEGFPTVIVLSSDGKQLTKKVGYDGQSAKDFIADLEKLKEKNKS
ncbi:MAG TPA: thioredoxin family protein [Candidatus Sulfotelmatobacter sp.]|nr:thioredoxin family protein [Candidatus Sulfotelmatobacter sp.]